MTQTLAESAIANLPPVALIDRKAFADAMARVSKVVERRNTIPILSNVRLAGAGESLVIEGTDLDIWFRLPVSAAADSRFAATVPAHTLRDCAKKASSEYVEIVDRTSVESEYATVALDFEGAKTSLQALPVTDWPLAENIEQLNSPRLFAFTMETATLRRMLQACELAISTEETRYYLNGVFAHTTKDEFGAPVFRIVATDGHRLVRTGTAIPPGAESFEAGAIIPRKTVALLLGELKRKGAPESVSIEIGAAWCSFKIGAAEIRSKTVDGTFPDYMRVIPQAWERVATVDAKAFAGMVKAVSSVSSEKGRAVKLAFAESTLQATVTNPDSGSASQSMAIDYAGDEIEIGFNARYIADIVESIGADRLAIKMGDAGGPARFEPAENNIATVAILGVQMPMRV